MNQLYFYSLFLFFMLVACGTTEQVPQGKLPPRTSSTPDRVTDEDLTNEINQLKSELQANPDDTAKLLRLASLYVELENAEEALATLQRLKDLNYKDEPKVYASLGQLYSDQEDFVSALGNYKIFKSLLPPHDARHTKVDGIIESLDFKIALFENPYDIKIEKLSPDINTEDSEYLSQFTIDGEQIVFTRRHNGQEDLFLANATGDDSYTVIPIEAVNTPLNEGAHTISADGSILIFTHCDEKFGIGGCDLYQSKRLPNGGWSRPANLGKRINTRHWESQPSLSADGRQLFFASNNPNGKGGSDIWVTTKAADGTWEIPKNLGSAINTTSREESPFIHADSKTLFFRSKGHPGIGNYDIYKATLENGKWKDITNLGTPINSTGNDGAMVVSLDGLEGYYATDLVDGEKRDHLDIVKFELPEPFRPQPMTYVKGRVVGRGSNVPLDAKVIIESENDEVKEYETDYNGNFLIAVPVGSPTHLHITSEGYVFYSDYISYDEVRHGVDPHVLEVALEKPILLDEEVETESIILKNIFFETGSAQLLAVSESEINYLYELLQQYPSIKIRITGHTDNVGSDSDNMTLSQNRAEAVKNELIKRGISEVRIVAEGKGETMPIDTNETAQGRANNRRTAFEIIR